MILILCFSQDAKKIIDPAAQELEIASTNKTDLEVGRTVDRRNFTRFCFIRGAGKR